MSPRRLDKYRQYSPNLGHQTPTFFINCGLALFDFKKIKEGELSITPDCRKTLALFTKGQETCPQGSPPGAWAATSVQ